MLEALRDGRVAADSSKRAWIENNAQFVPVDAEAPAAADAPTPDEPRKLRLNNRLRGLVETALASHQLLAADTVVRLAAARQLQRSARPAQLDLLSQRVASETDASVKSALTLALANLQMVDSSPSVRTAAVRLLGETGDPLARTRLESLLAPGVETDSSVRIAAETSLAQVNRKLMIGELLGQAFSGMSLGSILLLAALGLAITFGLLGVINMAHGEMLMLGAYSTYVVQLMFQRYAPGAIEYYLLIALPVAFFVTAMIGMALERTVIRHLYGRPLETLLATGHQSDADSGRAPGFRRAKRRSGQPAMVVRRDSGAAQSGAAVQPHRDHRFRAVRGHADLAAAEQNPHRPERACRDPEPQHGRLLRRADRAHRHDGVRTGLGHRRTGRRRAEPDRQRRPRPWPELHHRLVLVVVLGGVGQLAGSVTAAFGLGIANKILEPQIGAVLGKILILALIILFIQKRPQGLFALKGRVID